MAITDTHPEVERILTMLLRQAPVWRKLQMLGELNQTARQLALEGLRDIYPNATESELQWRDILGIIRQRAEQLDTEYLKDVAGTLQLADLLQRSLEEAQV